MNKINYISAGIAPFIEHKYQYTNEIMQLYIN